MTEDSPAYGGRRSPGSSSDIHKQIGARLRGLRQSKGMSVLLVSERSGVPAAGINLIESGVGDPSISTLDRLARALDIGLVVFLEK